MASLFVVLAYSVCRCQSEQKQMILTIEMDSLVLTEGDEAENKECERRKISYGIHKKEIRSHCLK